jgi:hypothetical protein
MNQHARLRERLAAREDNLTERKLEGVSSEDIARTLVAFANSVQIGSSAVLFIGITDEGRIVGVRNPDALQKTVRQVCEQKCHPQVEATISALSVQSDDRSADIVAVEAAASTRGPHFLGPAYVRVGAETVKLRDEQYDELFTRRLGKARQLLDWKSAIITVIVHGKKLGTTKRAGPDYRATHECTIEEVTPHFVRFNLLGFEQRCAEPMENLTLSWDEEQHRPMVLVREPRTTG